MVFERVGAAATSQSAPNSASIDIANGFAYFASSNTTTVSKVNLSTFTEAAVIDHGGSNFTLKSSVIDTNNGFLYIGAASIRKIRLSDFTVVGNTAALTIHLPCAVIDIVNGFAYFGTEDAPDSKIHRIKLSDLTVTTLTPPGGRTFDCAVIDTVNGFAYFGTSTLAGSVFKIKLSDFSYVATLNTTANRLKAAVIDTVNGFAYFASYANQKISKIRLSDFSEEAVLDISGTGLSQFRSAVIHPTNGFAYFGTEGTPGNVLKIKLSDFTAGESVTFNPGEDYAIGAVIDSANAFMYFGAQAQVVKVYDSDLLSQVSYITGRSSFSSRGASVSGGISAGKGKRRR